MMIKCGGAINAVVALKRYADREEDTLIVIGKLWMGWLVLVLPAEICVCLSASKSHNQSVCRIHNIQHELVLSSA